MASFLLPFEHMFFKVHGVEDLTNVEQLSIIPEIFSLVDQQVIRYLCYCYDKKLGLNKVYKDLSERKRQAAILAGYDTLSQDDECQMLYKLDDPDKKYASAAAIILKAQEDKIWTMIVMNEEVFYQYQEVVLRPVREDDKELLQSLQIKEKLLDSSLTIASRLEDLYKRMYGEDVEVLRKAGSYSSPESIVGRR